MEKAREYGLLVGKGGLYGNVFRLAPPLSLTPAEAEEGYAIMERAFEEVAGI
jgi:4-aminobutyrate aminotransferase-like enzyme